MGTSISNTIKNIYSKVDEGIKNEKNIKDNESEDNIDIMGVRNFYKTWEDAEARRRKGQRIYYKPGYGYYIVTPKKRAWWDIF